MLNPPYTQWIHSTISISYNLINTTNNIVTCTYVVTRCLLEVHKFVAAYDVEWYHLLLDSLSLGLKIFMIGQLYQRYEVYTKPYPYSYKISSVIPPHNTVSIRVTNNNTNMMHHVWCLIFLSLMLAYEFGCIIREYALCCFSLYY